MNNTTRKYPRTLQAAFGPYTNNVVYPKPIPVGRSWFWRVMFAIFGPR